MSDVPHRGGVVRLLLGQCPPPRPELQKRAVGSGCLGMLVIARYRTHYSEWAEGPAGIGVVTLVYGPLVISRLLDGTL